MAINLEGLPIVPGARTLTSGGPPIALNNEIRGGVHRISGTGSDTLADIDGRHLQAGMLVYNESDGMHYQYQHVAGTEQTNPADANDPFRNALGALQNETDNWIVFESGGGAGQVGFSLEQLGILTAAALPADEARFYHWFGTATSFNGSGLNNWSYDVSHIVAPYRAPAGADPLDQTQLEALYNAGGILTNSTGEVQTIFTIDVDLNILRTGVGGNATLELSFVHRTGSPGSYTYNHITTLSQAFGAEGFRTFEFLPRAGAFEVGVAETISVTLTALTGNQETNITGVRFSSTSSSWLNPVYPLPVELTSEQDAAIESYRRYINNHANAESTGTTTWISLGLYQRHDMVVFEDNIYALRSETAYNTNAQGILVDPPDATVIQYRNFTTTPADDANWVLLTQDTSTEHPAIILDTTETLDARLASGVAPREINAVIQSPLVWEYSGSVYPNTDPNDDNRRIDVETAGAAIGPSRQTDPSTGVVTDISGPQKLAEGYARYISNASANTTHVRLNFSTAIDRRPQIGGQDIATQSDVNVAYDVTHNGLSFNRPGTLPDVQINAVLGGKFVPGLLDSTFDPTMPVSDTNRIYLPSIIDLDRNDGPLVGTPNDTFTDFGTAAGLNAARTLDFADRSALVNAGSFQTAIGSVGEQITDTANDQRLEDHQGNEPVFTSTTRTNFPAGEIGVVVDEATDVFPSTDNRRGVGRRDATHSLEFRGIQRSGGRVTRGVLIIYIQHDQQAEPLTTWLAAQAAGDEIIRFTNGDNIDWRGTVANIQQGRTAGGIAIDTTVRGINVNYNSPRDLTFPEQESVILLDLDSRYLHRFTDDRNRWSVSNIGSVPEIYNFVLGTDALALSDATVFDSFAPMRYLQDSLARVQGFAERNNVTYVKNHVPGSTYEWDAVNVDRDGLGVGDLDLLTREAIRIETNHPNQLRIGGLNGAFSLIGDIGGIDISSDTLATFPSTVVTTRFGTTIEVQSNADQRAAVVEGEMYAITIVETNIPGLTAGTTYIADASYFPGGSVTLIRFGNLRLFDPATSRAGNTIDPLTTGFGTGTTITAHAFTSDINQLTLVNNFDNTIPLIVDGEGADANVFDFANIPTVQGAPLLERYVATSDVPPQPGDLVADQDYTIRVTNHTANDLVTPISISIDGLNASTTTGTNTGVPSGGTTEYSFTLNQALITSLANNFRDRPALDIRMRFGSVTIHVLDSAGGGGHTVTYTFVSGTDGTFEVDPSDGNPYTVGTGAVTPTGDEADRDVGAIAVFANDPSQIRGESFGTLLATNYIVIDSNLPLTAGAVEGGRAYDFRVYTRQIQSAAGSVTTDSFTIRADGLTIPIRAESFTGPDGVAAFAASRYTVTFPADRVTDDLIPLGDALISVSMDIGGIGELIAVHDETVTAGDVSVRGTPTEGQFARWVSANTIEGVVDPNINIADNRSEILSENKRVDQLENRIVALQNEVHNLEEGGTGIRYDSNEFRTATVRPTTIDELVQYTPQGGLPVQVQFNSSVDQFVMVERGSFSLPFAIRQALDNHLANIYQGLRGGTYTRTNAAGTNETLNYGGQIITRNAVLTLSGDGVTDLMIPLEIVRSTQGDLSHRLIYPWPVDHNFEYIDISARWFVNDLEAAPADSSIIIDEVPDPNDGVLEVPLSIADRAALLAETADVIVVRYTNIDGRAEERLVGVTAGRSYSTLAGFEYTNLTVADTTGPIHTQIGSEIFIAVGGLGGSSDVVANDTPATVNLTTLRVDDMVYNTLPLFTRKSDLFMGVEMRSRTRPFTLLAGGAVDVTVTEYVTEGVSYFFIDGIQRPASGDTDWTVGNGVWTTLDFIGTIAEIGMVTPENMANLIG